MFASQVKVNELKDCLHDKKIQIASMMEKTSEVRRMKDELQHDLSLVCLSFVHFESQASFAGEDVKNEL